jgi:methylmalonyl-CoA mutase
MAKETRPFSPITKEEWWKVIQKELKGKPENMLFTEWFDGMTSPPFHSWEEEIPRSPVFPEYAWHASESIHPDHAKADAMNSLNRGSDGLRLFLNDQIDLQKTLSDVQLEFIRTELAPDHLNGPWKGSWKKTLDSKNLKGQDINSALSYDILAKMAAQSAFHLNLKEQLRFIDGLQRQGLFKHAFLVDTSMYQNSGARIDTQLGIALAAAYEYMQTEEIGSLNKFHFRFAIGREYLPEIAKLRAFRELWAHLIKETGQTLPKEAVFISAESSKRPLSAIDPHSNLLRLTTMAMSAVLGGAQNIELHHHSIDRPRPKEKHLPLNILHMIRFEGRLEKLSDPLAGSYSIEALSSQIADLGWKSFQHIEKQGGLLHYLESGGLQNQIEEEAQAEQDRFDKGIAPIIGSSIYHYQLDKNQDVNKEAVTVESFPLRRLARTAEAEKNV